MEWRLLCNKKMRKRASYNLNMPQIQDKVGKSIFFFLLLLLIIKYHWHIVMRIIITVPMYTWALFWVAGLVRQETTAKWKYKDTIVSCLASGMMFACWRRHDNLTIIKRKISFFLQQKIKELENGNLMEM